MRVLKRGSAILVAGAGNREAARCEGGDISCYFVRVRRVDGERFVAGAGNREVVSCGRFAVTLGLACERMLFGGAGISQECPLKVSYRSIPQECPTRVSHKSVPQECPTRVSYKTVPQDYPTRVSHKSAPQECPTECPTRVSHKSVPHCFLQE